MEGNVGRKAKTTGALHPSAKASLRLEAGGTDTHLTVIRFLSLSADPTLRSSSPKPFEAPRGKESGLLRAVTMFVIYMASRRSSLGTRSNHCPGRRTSRTGKRPPLSDGRYALVLLCNDRQENEMMNGWLSQCLLQ